MRPVGRQAVQGARLPVRAAVMGGLEDTGFLELSVDPKWRWPFQVIRCYRSRGEAGVQVPVCSHRWEWVARLCCWLRADTDRYFHDSRRTPDRWPGTTCGS